MTHLDNDTSDSKPGDLAPRLENVELKMMELENTVGQLNEVIIAQYKQIDALQAMLNSLQQKMENAGTAHEAADPAEEPPPPHY